MTIEEARQVATECEQERTSNDARNYAVSILALTRCGTANREVKGYLGAPDFLLKHGREFEPMAGPLPAGLHRGYPKQCYSNCYSLSRRRGNREHYAYAEGYAVPAHCIPIAHAWLVDRKTGKAIEVTMREPATSYFGAVFTADALLKAKRLNDSYSMLFAWMGEHFNQLMEGAIKAEDILEVI